MTLSITLRYEFWSSMNFEGVTDIQTDIHWHRWAQKWCTIRQLVHNYGKYTWALSRQTERDAYESIVQEAQVSLNINEVL